MFSQRPLSDYSPAARIASRDRSAGRFSPAGTTGDSSSRLRVRSTLAASAATAKRLTLKVRIGVSSR